MLLVNLVFWNDGEKTLEEAFAAVFIMKYDSMVLAELCDGFLLYVFRQNLFIDFKKRMKVAHGICY